jgi:hypothetical protein
MSTFRKHLLQLDPRLIVEGEEEIEMNSEALLAEIKNILDGLSEDEVDELGAFLSVEFFETLEDEIEDLFFDVDNVIEMVKELGSEAEDEDEKIEIYSFILDLLLPEDFESSKYLDYDNEEEYEEYEGIDEGVARVMKAKNANRKKRKFFTKSAATLRKERSKRIKKNRENRAGRKAYTRVNKAKLKSYQKSRAKFMKKGKHFKKIRRQAGE